MVKRMLIDATHPEETRVVVVNGTRLEELDVETSTKRQLKGNIYLAKVVRVEPSLQAAFVEYGGNRHGFLAFSEIHPDYFQIPVADRQALLAAQRAEVMREASGDRDEVDPVGEGHLAAEAVAEVTDGTVVEDAPQDAAEGEQTRRKQQVETVGGDDDAENERRRARLLRHYKIQEVIKRRQIMLVQVVKEERGNKGAALTTYLSLAGRYCVLMPNTARGGGVSRKIVSSTDRRRLKAIANELDIPDGMAVIIRTAGSERSKTEIRRDYEYLLRMWDSVRELTLKSTAPALTYEEASLIKRSIRDLYSRDIDEVLVDGDEGYRLAKDYMRMLTPSHAKKVQPYRDPVMPMFHRYQVEAQLDAMHSPIVQLKSGGYIVISQTEALVAIDVNSGRATKERHIEETALKTNAEAADEVARQLRLRDLAGLIVIDFIDM
ncbi:MAG: ribonuclease E/G, partial [Magnetospirillum sp.]